MIVDIETTGHSPKKGDRMIQFAGVVLENKKIVDTYTTFINPEIPISPFITELTGISNEKVRNAPTFSEVADKILNLMDDAIFVAHNAHFDLTFLQEELESEQFPIIHAPVIDTVELTRILMPTLESYKLSDIAMYAGFEHDRPHQADSDAFVTAEWFLSLLDKLERLPIETILTLRDLSKYLKSDLSYLFDQIDLERTGQKRKRSDDLEFFRGIVLKRKKIENNLPLFGNQDNDSLLESMKNIQLDSSSLTSFIFDSLKNGELALIETEPEMNHKYSYLMAAAMLSMKKNKPVLVATATIHDLYSIEKELLPRLLERINLPISIQILKGKNRYLNLWKFERILHEESNQYDEVITKMQILVWLTETETGDGDELNLSTGGLQFWRRISAVQLVQDGKNPWQDRDFYRHAMKKASNAQIVVTNHHYLLTDLADEKDIFADFDYVIIDEAHLFEKNVLSIFGDRFTYRRVKYLLNHLGQTDQIKILGQVEKIVDAYNLKTNLDTNQVQEYMNHFNERMDEFFHDCVNLYMRDKIHSFNGRMVIEDKTFQSKLYYSWERAYDAFAQLYSCLETRLEQLFQSFHRLKESEKLVVEDFSLLLTDLAEIKQMDEEIQNHFHHKLIWFELDERNPFSSFVIHVQPLYIEDFLAETLYLKKKAILYISNALTIEHSFHYMINQLGLTDFPVITREFQNDKKKKHSVRFYSLNDLPNINEVDEQDYIEKICHYILTIAASAGRKLLVLFSSNEMLKKTYFLLKDSGALEEYLLMAQGISSGSLNRLAKQFTRFEKSILFSTNFNLDYIDLGHSPQTVIMVRLPFLSPKEPVHYRKARELKNKGINAFKALSLPEAVIRYKKCFVKLMDEQSKVKEIIMFDKRIFSTNYGQSFLNSIPDVPMEIVNLDELCEELEDDNG